MDTSSKSIILATSVVLTFVQDMIAMDPETHGATFCPIILGSDKTTVSVATGQNEYYPLYVSNGLVHNNVRRAHRDAVTLVAFLAIPKSESYFSDRSQYLHLNQPIVNIKAMLDFASSGVSCFMRLSILFSSHSNLE